MSDINSLIALSGSRSPNIGKTFMDSFYQGQDRAIATQDREKAAQKEQIAQARQNRLAELAGGDRANLSDTLMQNGYFDEAKQVGEVDKTQAETLAKHHETAQHQWEIAGQMVGGYANNPNVQKPQVLSGIEGLHKSGIIPDNIYQQKMEEVNQLPDDPAAINQWANTTLMQMNKSKDQLAQMHPDANARLQAQTSMRGQDITQENNLMGRDVDLSKKAFNPKSSSKAPTEFQGKSATYAARADEAEAILNGLNDPKTGEPTYSPIGIASMQSAANTPLLGGVLGAVGNSMLSDSSQKAEQAQRNFINAVLRQESGATISPSEFDNAKKQYFPQPGDSKATLQQKAQNRRTVIDSLKNNAGSVLQTGGASDSWQKPSDWDEFMKAQQ